MRKEIVEGFTRRHKARKGEVKGSRKAEYAKNLVGAGLAPALFYFTERGRTQEKVVEFAQRRKARKERVKGFTQRRKPRKGEVKGSRKAEYAKNLVGAGLAPALFYFTERGRTQEKVVEFAQRRRERKEMEKGVAQRRRERKEMAHPADP